MPDFQNRSSCVFNVLRNFAGVVLLAYVLSSLSAWLTPALAQSDDLEFIRDAEIENYLHELAAPVYHAAGIDPKSITIVVVGSSTVNAFVAGGMNEFFYTGLLELTDTPEQMVGVMAHETGHIAGGHLIRGREEMENASAEAILGMILGAAAGIAARNGQMAAGAMSGGEQIAERSFLTFSRTVEASADAAGMSFLDRSGISVRGMLEFFEKLQGQEYLPTDRQSEYVRTHPLTEDRIAAVRDHLDNSPDRLKNAKLDPRFYQMHERMKAKLLGYLQPEQALLRYTDKDDKISSRYALAIACYRTSQFDRAMKLVNSLIQAEPNNPFFYELRAQMQFENGHVDEAVAGYKKANELLPDSSLLRQAYGHALLESKSSGNADLAIQQLLEANRLEEREPLTWRLLASAWGQKYEITKDVQYEGMVTYALAEEAVAKGNNKTAGQYAARAMKVLPKGSTYWLRAQDIKLSTAPDADEKHEKSR